MQPIQQSLQVTYHYSVHFTNHLFVRENPLLRDVIDAGGSRVVDSSTHPPRKILCVVDRGVWHKYEVYLTLPAVSGAAGTARVWVDGTLALNRDPSLPADRALPMSFSGIGGGAVIDMVGYAAATAHRGVRLIRVPTTVLSQNDSGIGVKNSINAFGKKNFLGTFAPPVAVLNDADFLTTLSARDWRSGISEAIKVAVLKDAEFFEFIEQKADRLVDRDMQTMLWLIYRCAQLHLDHITTSGDPFEFGSSRPLDFGHWAAHKLEQLSDYTLRHGEAVAIGIALDSTYSYLKGLLPQRDWQRILGLLSASGLAVYTRELSPHLYDQRDNRCIFTGLQEFREHLGGQLTLPMLERIGQGIEVNEVDEQTMRRSMTLLEEYQSTQRMEKRQ